MRQRLAGQAGGAPGELQAWGPALCGPLCRAGPLCRVTVMIITAQAQAQRRAPVTAVQTPPVMILLRFCSSALFSLRCASAGRWEGREGAGRRALSSPPQPPTHTRTYLHSHTHTCPPHTYNPSHDPGVMA